METHIVPQKVPLLDSDFDLFFAESGVFTVQRYAGQAASDNRNFA